MGSGDGADNILFYFAEKSFIRGVSKTTEQDLDQQIEVGEQNQKMNTQARVI